MGAVAMFKPLTPYRRLLSPRVHEALTDTPVVFIAGPRQAGKTTLALQLAQGTAQYITLDNERTLLAAKRDPIGLVRGIDRAIIDEIQRAPELLLSIKRSVDEDRRPGRFLLTGSANLMTLPTVTDSLAGRMETLTLLPLSMSELTGTDGNWLDEAFEGRLLATSTPLIGDALIEAVIRGGYPEAISRSTPRRRTAWARQYVNALIQRDVRDIAAVDHLDQMPRFLSAIAETAGQMCNYSRLGSEVGLDHKTAARYLTIFEQMYLLQRVNVWANNRLKRLVKTPKIQFIDSGLLSALTGVTASKVEQDRSLFGRILETFVFGELLKHATTAEGSYRMLYYRDSNQVEVDFIVENEAGGLIGVEVKAAASIKASDLHGLKRLAMLTQDKFKMGVILYDGADTLPMGDRLWIAPISSLWGVPQATHATNKTTFPKPALLAT